MYYCIDESADEPIMLLDKHIGYDDEDGQGVDGAIFAQELLRLDTMGKKSIQIYINCPGGNVIDGMSIYNAMLKSKTPVDTHNVGIAASMGGVCFMGGRKRIMSDYASLMIHAPSDPANEASNNAINSFRNSLAVMLSARSGVTKENVEELMNVETWLTAAQCFEKGFCTEIAPTADANIKRMPKTDIRAMWKTANEITNNLFNKNIVDMKKVTAKLKLVDGADENTILGAIETMENTHTTAIQVLKDSETGLKDKVTKFETTVSGITATLKKVTAKLGLKEDVTEAEIETALGKVADEAAGAETARTAQLKTNAEGIVNAGVKIGKIANKKETIEGWVKLAIADFDGTKKMIEELPLNKTATSITDKFEGDKADATIGLGVTAAGVMLQVQNKLANRK